MTWFTIARKFNKLKAAKDRLSPVGPKREASKGTWEQIIGRARENGGVHAEDPVWQPPDGKLTSARSPMRTYSLTSPGGSLQVQFPRAVRMCSQEHPAEGKPAAFLSLELGYWFPELSV